MKLYCFALLFVIFAPTFAQGGRHPTDLTVQRCYNGSSHTTVNEVNCDFSVNSCMTKIETQSSFFKASRECTQTQACKNNAAGNIPKCSPGENGVRICFFCCQNDLCNWNDFATEPEMRLDSGDGEVDES